MNQAALAGRAFLNTKKIKSAPALVRTLCRKAACGELNEGEQEKKDKEKMEVNKTEERMKKFNKKKFILPNGKIIRVVGNIIEFIDDGSSSCGSAALTLFKKLSQESIHPNSLKQ